MFLTMPVDYWQLAKSHQKGWGRNRSLCVTWKNTSCSTLYSRGPAVSPSQPHFLTCLSSEHQGHSEGINPAVIMPVRVTGSVACVETPVVLWLQCSASGVLPAATHAHPRLSSVRYIENNHTASLVAQSPVSLLNKDSKQSLQHLRRNNRMIYMILSLQQEFRHLHVQVEVHKDKCKFLLNQGWIH